MVTSLKDSSQQGGQGLSDIGAHQSTDGDKESNNGNTIMPNWKERIDISVAKSRKIRGSNYVQISTINYETMEPRCRTVVFRGFLKEVPFGAVEKVLGSKCGVADYHSNSKYTDCVMKMITDSRSNKVKELEMFHANELLKSGKSASNTAEMVWW